MIVQTVFAFGVGGVMILAAVGAAEIAQAMKGDRDNTLGPEPDIADWPGPDLIPGYDVGGPYGIEAGRPVAWMPTCFVCREPASIRYQGFAYCGRHALGLIGDEPGRLA